MACSRPARAPREGVDRGFAQNFLGAFLLTRRVIPFFAAARMEKGSQQYVRLAADPTLATVSGRYFLRGKENTQGSSPLSLDPAIQQRIDDTAEAPLVSTRRHPNHPGTTHAIYRLSRPACAITG